MVSRWAYLPDYPLGLLIVQLVLLTLNVVALILSVVKKQPLQGSRFVWFYLLLLVSFNALAIFSPRFFSDFEIGLFAIDAVLMLSNLLGVALSVFYVKKLELYANITETVPNLPSYGPEVNLTSSVQYINVQKFLSLEKYLNFWVLQDVPMGPVEENERSFRRNEETLTAQVISLSIFLVGNISWVRT